MKSKKTLVLGASEHSYRYSFLAVNKLVSKGHEVIAIGSHTGRIGAVPILTDWKNFENIDTVTLYLNPRNQETYYDKILSLHPRRMIFNPGAENQEFESLAASKGIVVQEACTLVLLSTGMY
jgi:predicted CoA-binding protein